MPAGKWFRAFVDVLVPASRRYRWPLVAGAVLIMLCGAAALFGIPGKVAPLALEMDVLTYVNPSERVAQDTRHFEESNGLDVVELWLQTPPGHALDPEFLRGVEQLTRRLEQRSAHHRRRRSDLGAALGALHRIRIRSIADSARGLAEAGRRSRADHADRTRRAQLRRRDGPCECAA